MRTRWRLKVSRHGAKPPGSTANRFSVPSDAVVACSAVADAYGAGQKFAFWIEAMTEVPEVTLVKTRSVRCDGGGGALGHPLVYYTIGVEGFVECGYCDRRFVLIGSPADETETVKVKDDAET